jgi:hypothetical protein
MCGQDTSQPPDRIVTVHLVSWKPLYQNALVVQTLGFDAIADGLGRHEPLGHLRAGGPGRAFNSKWGTVEF